MFEEQAETQVSVRRRFWLKHRQKQFFTEIGTSVNSRTMPLSKLDEAPQFVFMEKSAKLSPKYITELLQA